MFDVKQKYQKHVLHEIRVKHLKITMDLGTSIDHIFMQQGP